MTIVEALSILEAVYGPFSADDGIDESRLQRCESRLGRGLPDALRALYVRTGAHALHQACDRLVAPESLAFQDGCLVFYEQQQMSLVWGVEEDQLFGKDPPVMALYGDEMLPDSASISQFACFIAAEQGVNGALPHYGILDEYSDDGVPFTSASFDKLGKLLAVTRHGSVRCCAGVLAVHRSEGGGYLGLASRSASEFNEAARDLGVPMDWWTISSFNP